MGERITKVKEFKNQFKREALIMEGNRFCYQVVHHRSKYLYVICLLNLRTQKEKRYKWRTKTEEYQLTQSEDAHIHRPHYMWKHTAVPFCIKNLPEDIYLHERCQKLVQQQFKTTPSSFYYFLTRSAILSSLYLFF